MSRRRPPLKVAPSPASERPENKAVDEIVKSSRAQQARMRNSAESHSDQLAEEPIAPEEDSKKPEATSKSAPRKRSKPKPEPIQAERESTGKPSIKMSIYVPVNLPTRNAAKKVAEGFGKDGEYVIAGCLKKASKGIKDRWKSDDLKSLVSDARLLLDQQSAGGTNQHRMDLSLSAELTEDMRSLWDDPLDLITINKKVAAFFGAELMAQLKAM